MVPETPLSSEIVLNWDWDQLISPQLQINSSAAQLMCIGVGASRLCCRARGAEWKMGGYELGMGQGAHQRRASPRQLTISARQSCTAVDCGSTCGSRTTGY